MKTILETLQNLSKSNSSTEQDEKVILYLLRKLGFHNAVVTCGIVYPEGSGHPSSIQQIARQILTITTDKKNCFAVQ